MNDSYPLSNIKNILHNLGEGKLFPCLDLKQDYHQIPPTADSKALTAFVTHEGLYEHIVLFMGLKDSPMSFCRIINQVLIGDSNIPPSSQIPNSRSPNFSQNVTKL